MATCQPIQRRSGIYPRRIRDGGQRGHVRQRAARWVFPRLPRGAGNPGDLRRLCLAQVGQLAPVLEPALDDLSIAGHRAAGEKRSLCVHLFSTSEKNHVTKSRRHPAGREIGLSAILPGIIRHQAGRDGQADAWPNHGHHRAHARRSAPHPSPSPPVAPAPRVRARARVISAI